MLLARHLRDNVLTRRSNRATRGLEHEPRVLVLVENLSVPFDRRVWDECTTLRKAGFNVSVICPRGTDRDLLPFEGRDGVKIYRFALKPAAGGALGYVREYGAALVQMSLIIRKLSKNRRFDVVHACSPPDLLLLPAWRLKRRHGSRLIFDHHDLSPELYLSRFGGEEDLVYRVLRRCEALSFRLADVVIATNDSYREIALTRGGKSPEDVFVVRNGPDPTQFTAGDPDDRLKKGREYLIAYVGVMGPQDGVDCGLRALAELAKRRTDWRAIFVGAGEVLQDMRDLAIELGLRELVEFTGLLERSEVIRVLSTADVCLAPEPSSPLNDRSTMVKIAEYMAVARPVVAFELHETRLTAQDAALYAPPNDEAAFAARIEQLLNDDRLRRELGSKGRQRVESELSWSRSEEQLLAAYEHALAGSGKHPMQRADAVAV
jgi:glycosyltransferase involved in cell wall biosynthesis